MAAQVESCLLTSRAVSERNVIVSDVVEEVDLLLVKQDTSSDGVDRRISPAFVEETSILVKRLEEVDVSLATEPVQVANFEVGPLDIVSKSIRLFRVVTALTKWHLL